MKPMMTQVKDNAGLLGILGGLLLVAGSFSQLEKLAWIINAPSVAYAGQAVAEDTKDKFERYLERQEAFTEALQEYTQQQQQLPNQTFAPQPSYPPIKRFKEQDSEGYYWCCDAYERSECWRKDRNGVNQWWPCSPDEAQ